ncbi:hypothetical protein [Janthinobacterium sp. SUN033]|uniref:hypothetical protein n=1 Tax=Janthinobacterium sp. SUN033 TaxID=3002439 RepID=UPI0025B0E7C9|nr:hypothetical protein [Janthinobacterium sp. SUN033]MDN2676690.1 hypothetical protein [Janthinobacterium sp. SUN033]
MKNENYANDLVLGIVSLGTLEMCRAYEDPFQGDAKEAMHSYNSGIIIGDGSDTNFQKIARALQISVSEDCYDISFINTHSSRKIEDAYVICTSEFFIKEDFKESFGDYCVEISDPDLFYSLISEALEKIFIIKSSSWGAVQYRERHFEGLDDPNGMIGFIKPEKYDSQNEIRFLWECINKDRSKIEKLDRLNINIPGIRALCRRVL